MPKYTTGEIAKLCGVSVRTVQYYDTRGILIPSELSEGGRRIYTEKDLRKMKIICFLREIDLPINSIGDLLKEEHPENVISLLLEEQEKELRAEIAERQTRADKLQELKQTLRMLGNFSVESIGDVAHIMKNRKQLKKVRGVMFAVGIPLEALEVSTLMVGILKGIWWPFAVAMCVSFVLEVILARYYFKRSEYICPQCHEIFRPTFREVFFAGHTSNTRKLTCIACGHRGFCVETYAEPVKKEKAEKDMEETC